MLSLSTIKFVAYAAIVLIFWCGMGEGTLLRQLQCPDTTVVQNFDREQVTFLGCRKLTWKSAMGFVQVNTRLHRLYILILSILSVPRQMV